MIKSIINLSFWMVLACSSLYAKAEYIDLAYGHMNQFAKTIKRTECIDTFGTGGSMLACVRELSLSMSCKRSVDVEEARQLCVKIASELCDQVNKDKKIRPYLQNFPFTVRNMFIGIIFEDEQGHVVSKDYLGRACICNSCISYETYLDGNYKEIYRENFEEACKRSAAKI